MASRQRATVAEVSLNPNNRNCLVNLPPSLVNQLDNAKVAAQNCIVELQLRAPNVPSSAPSRSIYVGWSGLTSKPKSSLTSSRSSKREQTYASSTGPTEVPTIELDSAFARTLNVQGDTKIGILLHLDPPVAHTVHIEPQTPADWDIIELHATFLETNLLAQIRALPNPQYAPATQKKDVNFPLSHPLTIHLSPTSTANVIVTQLAPSVPKEIAFAKIGPDSEVIVAPKTRALPVAKTDNKTVVSGSVRSGRTAGTNKQRSQRAEARAPALARGVCARIASKHVFTEEDTSQAGLSETEQSEPLKIYVDDDLRLATKSIRHAEWVTVSIVTPSALSRPSDPLQLQNLKESESSEAGSGTTRIVARLLVWHSAPLQTSAVLSDELCQALGNPELCGDIIRIEPTSPPVKDVSILHVYPFSSSQVKQNDGLKFGGETRAGRETAAKKFRGLMGRSGPCNILGGPLTNGMLLPEPGTSSNGWFGGILKFANATASGEGEKHTVSWARVNEDHMSLEIQPEITRPVKNNLRDSGHDALALSAAEPLIGVQEELKTLRAHAEHGSSILLSGGQGSGKTALALALAKSLQENNMYNVSYFPCENLVTDETRVSTVKETLQRLFMQSAWGSRLGGRAIIIFDDLDKLCPAEEELQVGNDNARSRQSSELFCVLARQFCSKAASTVLIATARGKESLHNVIIGGHILPETVEVRAPDKSKRREILNALLDRDEQANFPSHSEPGKSEPESSGPWADESAETSEPGGPNSSLRQTPQIDILDIAGRTDGFMPADLHLLFSRARVEAIKRLIMSDSSKPTIPLEQEDFDRALDGFTPSSLRNVTLQTSSTTFSAIGGLKETRKTLLETLQYPTTYAPIFAQCPLRLRSGLLLYGYPGCGKTLLASAVAGECGLNFISVKGPEILNKYIGASEKSVRDLFERAQAARPCVLFFDEFDSIAPKRGHDSTGVTDRVVNQLLTQMDGAEGLSGVYVLAATSRPDLIDPALLRPGRLDKSLLCDMPDEDDRLDILRALTEKLKVSDKISQGTTESSESLFEVARRTKGYSGADMQAVIYNAYLEAIHDLFDEPLQVNGANHLEGSKATKSAERRQSTNINPGNHELIQFKYGDVEERASSAVRTGPRAAKERAALLAKLEAQRVAKRREREAKRGGAAANNWQHSSSLAAASMNGSADAAKNSKSEDEPNVVIEWANIESSLTSTRSSISARELMKLKAIYNEFVQGRNGEMPNGQGPMEVGARSSLM